MVLDIILIYTQNRKIGRLNNLSYKGEGWCYAILCHIENKPTLYNWGSCTLYTGETTQDKVQR